MKSINFRVMAALLALVVSESVQASKWESVFDSPGKKLAIDVSSITVRDGKVRAWSRVTYPRPQPLSSDPANNIMIAKVMEFAEYDCDAKDSRRISATFYDPQDMSIYTLPAEATPQVIVPDSVGDRFLKRVCAEKKAR